MGDEPKTRGRLSKGFNNGLVIGWIVGMVWWLCLAIYFRAIREKTFVHDGITVEKHISLCCKGASMPR